MANLTIHGNTHVEQARNLIVILRAYEDTIRISGPDKEELARLLEALLRKIKETK